MSAAKGFFYNNIYHAKFFKVLRSQLKCLCRFHCTGPVTPQDCCTPFRRYDRVYCMFKHHDTVAYPYGKGAAAPAFTDDRYNNRHLKPAHLKQVSCNSLCLSALLSPDSRIGPRGINKCNDWFVKLLCKTHQAQGLSVTLRVRHSEIPVDLVPRSCAFLMSNDNHRPLTKIAYASDYCRIICKAPVPVEFNKIIDKRTDIVCSSGS